MQYNENKYITLTRINDINYYLKNQISEIFKNRPNKDFCLNATQ